MHKIIALVFLALAVMGSVAVVATVNSPPVKASCQGDNC
jgi:hypothetical protein